MVPNQAVRWARISLTRPPGALPQRLAEKGTRRGERREVLDETPRERVADDDGARRLDQGVRRAGAPLVLHLLDDIEPGTDLVLVVKCGAHTIAPSRTTAVGSKSAVSRISGVN